MELIAGTTRNRRPLGQWLATAICGNDITSSALLGVSGFERSANFVEAQDHGVFPTPSDISLSGC